MRIMSTYSAPPVFRAALRDFDPADVRFGVNSGGDNWRDTAAMSALLPIVLQNSAFLWEWAGL